MYCRNCGSEMHNEAVVCVKCGVPAGKGNNYCNNCGSEVNPEAVFCVNCGVSLSSPETSVPKGEKSRIVAGLLGIFLGALGVHNFYIARKKRAATQLVFTLSFPFSIIMIFAGLIFSLLTGMDEASMDSLMSVLAILMLLGLGCFIASFIWSFIEAILLLCGATKTDGRGNPFRD